MDKKSKFFYASPELLPAITEGLLIQLQENFRVKTSDRSTGNIDIEIFKNERLALLGCKIYKQISFSTTPTGQIMCQIYGDGFGGIVLPIIIAAIAFSIPVVGQLVTIIIAVLLIKTSIDKKKVNEEVFSMVQEIINAAPQMQQAETGTTTCPKCGSAVEGSGFCPECGTKI